MRQAFESLCSGPLRPDRELAERGTRSSGTETGIISANPYTFGGGFGADTPRSRRLGLWLASAAVRAAVYVSPKADPAAPGQGVRTTDSLVRRGRLADGQVPAYEGRTPPQGPHLLRSGCSATEAPPSSGLAQNLRATLAEKPTPPSRIIASVTTGLR